MILPKERERLFPLVADVGANPYVATLTEHRESLYNYCTTEESIVTLLCHPKSTTYVRAVVNHNRAPIPYEANQTIPPTNSATPIQAPIAV